MLKIYTGITPLKVKTDNLETIPSAVCDDLSVGDVVVFVDGGEDFTYVVSQKCEKDKITLTQTNSTEVVDVLYTYSEEWGWGYEDTYTTELGESGTKLYKHHVVITLDNNSTITFDIVNLSAVSYAENVGFEVQMCYGAISMCEPDSLKLISYIYAYEGDALQYNDATGTSHEEDVVSSIADTVTPL